MRIFVIQKNNIYMYICLYVNVYIYIYIYTPEKANFTHKNVKHLSEVVIDSNKES